MKIITEAELNSDEGVIIINWAQRVGFISHQMKMNKRQCLEELCCARPQDRLRSTASAARLGM